MSDTTGYSRLQIALHWSVALLVAYNYIFGEAAGEAFDQIIEGEGGAAPGTPLHIWVGLAVLALVVLRLVVRFAQGAPSAEAGLQGQLASWGHRLLYVLMLAVPVGGAVAWFSLNEEVGDIHGAAANALMILAGLHAVVALGHHFVLKDGILMRMLRAR